MIYKEKQLSRINIFFVLTLASLVIYSPWFLGIKELSTMEGLFASIIADMNIVPLSKAHGEVIAVPPLFHYIAYLFKSLNLSYELSLRITSILSILLLSLLSGLFILKVGKIQVTAIVMSIILSCLITMQKGLLGEPLFLGVLFIYTGWGLFFYYGVLLKKWNYAGFYASLLCLLTYFTVGGMGVLYFLLPLTVMKRPLRIWNKLTKRGFLLGISILLIGIILWMIFTFHAPGQSFQFVSMLTLEYSHHLLSFPFVVCIRLLPWSIIMWTPFCLAFISLEKVPVLTMFLRRITVTLFLFLWLNPYTESIDIIIIIPAIAIMTGMNYWLLIRRYGYILHKIIKCFAIILLLGSTLGILFYLLPVEYVSKMFKDDVNLTFHQESFRISMIYLGTLFLISLSIIYSKVTTRKVIWLNLLYISMGIMLFYWSTIYQYQCRKREQSILAMEIKNNLGTDFNEKTVLYKDGQVSLYGVCSYLNYDVIKIKNYDDLKSLNNNKILLLTTSFNTFIEREWTNLYSFEFENITYNLWEGVLKSESP